MKPHAFLERLAEADFASPYGRVRKVTAGMIEASGPAGQLGDLCDIECFEPSGGGLHHVAAEIAAVDQQRIVLIPLEQGAAIRLDAKVVARSQHGRVAVGDGFAGRAINALGQPIDAGGPVRADAYVPLGGSVPKPMERADPSQILHTGLRAIDGLLTLGIGQRVGIFAASGVGKTSVMEQLAVQTGSDRTILCLVGERGREVEALWRQLSEREDASRFTVVAATSDESAALRVRCVQYALCLADYWRSRGEHVVLMIDSVTRMAMALREIGLAAGAPPTVRAYTPNVFAALPRIVERCGAVAEGGAITAIMTVLSETDDVDDPIVELMKSLLDGHIILSRTLAEQGHFPAIDIARSISRQSDRLVSGPHAEAMRGAAAMLAVYDDARVMIESGVYKSGSNPAVDRAIAVRDDLREFLCQTRHERAPLAQSVERLRGIVGGIAAHA
ncbi:FliI/YscN family ATPase [Sphingomonas sp. So64.6b]|uniref:FliI/YscN family ATPase n=1 Tax=Sphingomonas sp. So64.6b TaxID=2997354 RepID=UPI00160056A5|nr:FliI/YscN family ATPase [Sphingomonas sp. So64.6b]QNA82931.1 FliI/YscN family ATPase [Sphingomonas sp. So64.6b]